MSFVQPEEQGILLQGVCQEWNLLSLQDAAARKVNHRLCFVSIFVVLRVFCFVFYFILFFCACFVMWKVMLFIFLFCISVITFLFTLSIFFLFFSFLF